MSKQSARAHLLIATADLERVIAQNLVHLRRAEEILSERPRVDEDDEILDDLADLIRDLRNAQMESINVQNTTRRAFLANSPKNEGVLDAIVPPSVGYVPPEDR